MNNLPKHHNVVLLQFTRAFFSLTKHLRTLCEAQCMFSLNKFWMPYPNITTQFFCSLLECKKQSEWKKSGLKLMMCVLIMLRINWSYQSVVLELYYEVSGTFSKLTRKKLRMIVLMDLVLMISLNKCKDLYLLLLGCVKKNNWINILVKKFFHLPFILWHCHTFF